MTIITKNQESCLMSLALCSDTSGLPSSKMRTRENMNPGAVLSRMAKRGWVEPTGISSSDGIHYRLTELGFNILRKEQNV